MMLASVYRCGNTVGCAFDGSQYTTIYGIILHNGWGIQFLLHPILDLLAFSGVWSVDLLES